MHIMKLECLAKIPFGLYAELERSNSLLTEINTADGDQCLESLKVGACFRDSTSGRYKTKKINMCMFLR